MIRSEIRAIGSTVYEPITGTCRFRKENEGVNGMAAALMREGRYLGVGGLPLGNVISKCWKGEYESAGEVTKAFTSWRRPAPLATGNRGATRGRTTSAAMTSQIHRRRLKLSSSRGPPSLSPDGLDGYLLSLLAKCTAPWYKLHM